MSRLAGGGGGPDAGMKNAPGSEGETGARRFALNGKTGKRHSNISSMAAALLRSFFAALSEMSKELTAASAASV